MTGILSIFKMFKAAIHIAPLIGKNIINLQIKLIDVFEHKFTI